MRRLLFIHSEVQNASIGPLPHGGAISQSPLESTCWKIRVRADLGVRIRLEHWAILLQVFNTHSALQIISLTFVSLSFNTLGISNLFFREYRDHSEELNHLE